MTCRVKLAIPRRVATGAAANASSKVSPRQAARDVEPEEAGLRSPPLQNPNVAESTATLRIHAPNVGVLAPPEEGSP